MVRPLAELAAADLPQVGGKNASLGELHRSLAAVGVRVPEGFAVTVEAFHRHLQEAGLVEIGIDSISVNPDAFAELAETLATADGPRESAEGAR
jgi:pyruvate,water dikinase